MAVNKTAASAKKTASAKKKSSAKTTAKKQKLLIVESPAKAGTIKKYLGSDYNVMASMGHVIDLPKSQLGVDIEDGFKPRYITIRGKGELLSELKKAAAKASAVYLATDPDREGEAISWHLARALKIDPQSKCRVTFNEITKSAVKNAMKEPRTIDMNLVDAQQARRVLDRIVGYQISPLLWDKVKKGLSAGRVQSVATRLICDREEEIENFTPREYWTVEAVLLDGKKAFEAKYYGDGNEEKPLDTKEEAEKILRDVENAVFTVKSVKQRELRKNPPPPFTTSTLQQDASRKFGFATAKTMQVAQSLYEGVNLGGKLGTIGLITYMRTDSLRIADDAQAAAVDYIVNTFGKEYSEPKQFKTKKSAQDAHEAIRPTEPALKPSQIKDKLTNEQYKLYTLIWERFIASQMSAAVLDTVSAAIEAAGHIFRSAGSAVKFNGFTAVYEEASEKKKQKMIPPLKEGQEVGLKDITPSQHFTQPPPRFSEASLVKELEENGIGRPSTYAPTITTIISRGYVVRNKRQLIPTELGMITTDIMKKNFPNIVDVEFTAGMEEELDEVEDGRRSWDGVLSEFYPPFEEELENAKVNIEKIQIKDEESDVICEKCGRRMVYKLSKFGKFLACPGYPECRNTKSIRDETGVKCPKCGGEILRKRSRKGKTYYACENLPKCDFMAWDQPVKDERCPKCGGLLLKRSGRNSERIFCNTEGCGYKREEAK